MQEMPGFHKSRHIFARDHSGVMSVKLSTKWRQKNMCFDVVLVRNIRTFLCTHDFVLSIISIMYYLVLTVTPDYIITASIRAGKEGFRQASCTRLKVFVPPELL